MNTIGGSPPHIHIDENLISSRGDVWRIIHVRTNTTIYSGTFTQCNAEYNRLIGESIYNTSEIYITDK